MRFRFETINPEDAATVEASGFEEAILRMNAALSKLGKMYVFSDDQDAKAICINLDERDTARLTHRRFIEKPMGPRLVSV